MKYRHLIAIFVASASVLQAAAPPRGGGLGPPPAAHPASPEGEAPVTQRIIELSSIGPIQGTEIAQNLIRARAAELAPKFGLSVKDMPEWLEFSYGNYPRSNGIMLNVQFTKPDDSKADPDQFLNALVDGIGKPIEKAYLDFQRDQIRNAKEHQASLEKKVAAATQSSADLRRRIGDLTERVSNTDDGIHSAAAKLEDELQALDLDLMAKTERSKAMEEQIASQSGVIAKKMDDDPIVSELQKVVDARSSALDLLKQQQTAGVTTPKEVTDGIAALADARAKLLERKRQAAIEAGGDVIQGFTRDLLTLSIDLREMKVRKEVIEQRLGRLREASQLLDRVHTVETDGQSATNELQGVVPAGARFGGVGGFEAGPGGDSQPMEPQPIAVRVTIHQ